jgi:hypothetical protein
MTMAWAVGAARFALGLTLALAAFWKIRDLTAFRAGLSAYGLRGSVGRYAAVALIGVEALTAGLAVSPVGDPPVGSLAAGLGLVFLASQVYVLSTGASASCLCFGTAETEPVSARSVVRAALVLGAGLLVLFAGATEPRRLDASDLVAGVALVAVCWIVLRRPLRRRPARPTAARRRR